MQYRSFDEDIIKYFIKIIYRLISGVGELHVP